MRKVRLGGAPTVPPAAEVHVVAGEAGSVTLDTAFVTAMSALGRRIEETVREQRLAAVQQGHASRARAAGQLMASGHFEQAVDLLEEIVDENPDQPQAWEALARACLADGETGDAVEAMIEWSRTGSEDAPSSARPARRAPPIVGPP